jgi:hypothetical protein
MRIYSISAVMCVLSCVYAPANAQIAPGVRQPATVEDAVAMSHLFGCIGAVTDRPTNGLNIALNPTQKGVFIRDNLDVSLKTKLGDLSSSSKFLELQSPEGSAWTIFDPTSKKCSVTAIVKNPQKIGVGIAEMMENIKLPRLESPAVVSSNGQKLPTFDWQISGTPKLGTPSVHLRVSIEAIGEAENQIVITSTAIQSD